MWFIWELGSRPPEKTKKENILPHFGAQRGSQKKKKNPSRAWESWGKKVAPLRVCLLAGPQQHCPADDPASGRGGFPSRGIIPCPPRGARTHFYFSQIPLSYAHSLSTWAIWWQGVGGCAYKFFFKKIWPEHNLGETDRGKVCSCIYARPVTNSAKSRSRFLYLVVNPQ